MADLVTEVQRRVSHQFLVELTNQDETGGQQIDADRLLAAAQDAEAAFLTQAGTAYDGTDKTHVQVCLLGVLYYLHLFTGRYTDALREAREAWTDALRRFATARGDRARMLPVTSSPLEQSTERTGTRPDFDRSRWDQVVLDMPGPETDPDSDG